MERARKRQPLSSLPAKFHSQRSQSEPSKLPESSKSPPVGLLSPPPRWPGRQFHRCVSRSPVSPDACKKILSSFDFEKSDREQSEPVILELEKWMGYEGWPWVDKHDRARIIRDKAFSTLYKFLWSHRFVFYPSSLPFAYAIIARVLTNVHSYYWLISTVVDGKPRLLISPKEGITPLPLPEWLSTPYILPVPHQDFTYEPESSRELCENPAITSGHAIWDSDERRVGTFSCLMNTTRNFHTSKAESAF